MLSKKEWQQKGKNWTSSEILFKEKKRSQIQLPTKKAL
jgi:hypothetical protein